ncbi:ribosome maturation factor RimM [Petrimonas sp.]
MAKLSLSAVNMPEDLVAIGKIVAPHGVRGDVRIIPLTDFPERFQQLKTAYFDDGTRLSVESARQHKQFILLKFKGLQDRNAVENLRGKLVKVPRKDLVPLPEGHYYIFEIIGLKVYDIDGAYLGKVTDVMQTGSNDVYVVEDCDRPLLIPAIKEVVKEIDLAQGRMVIKPQEEWE